MGSTGGGEQGSRVISRRDFLKLGAAVIGGGLLEGALTTFTSLPKDQLKAKPTPVHIEISPAEKKLDPHLLTTFYPENAATGLLVDERSMLRRAVEPPANIQSSLDEAIKVSIPWQGKDHGKPDAPLGKCIFELPDGTKREIDLAIQKETQLQVSTEEPQKISPDELERLSAVFDRNSGSALITDEHGVVLRVVPPPSYQQGLADGKYTANIPYHEMGQKVTDVPLACVIKTPDGKQTTHPVELMRAVKVVKQAA